MSEAHGCIQLTTVTVTVLFRCGSHLGFKGWHSWTHILCSQKTEAASGVLCLIQRIPPWVTRAGFTLGTRVSFEPHKHNLGVVTMQYASHWAHLDNSSSKRHSKFISTSILLAHHFSPEPSKALLPSHFYSCLLKARGTYT